MDDEVEIGGEAGEYLLNMLGCGEEVALDLQNIFGDGGEHCFRVREGKNPLTTTQSFSSKYSW